jgi:hypothetical protein
MKRLNKKEAGSLNNQQDNYLDKIPVRNGDLDWIENNELVTVIQKNNGLYDRMAQKLFKTPSERQDRPGPFRKLCMASDRWSAEHL